MAAKKPSPLFGQRHGSEIVTQALGGGYFSRSSGMVGRKSSGQAKAMQSGSDLAKNYRASGKAGSVTATKPASRKTYQKSKLSKFLGF